MDETPNPTPPSSLGNEPAPSPAPASALLDQVEPRSYAGGNIAVDPGQLQQPLPEAPIGMASAATEEDIFQAEIDRARAAKGQGASSYAGFQSSAPASGKGASGAKGGGAAPKDYSNPELKGLSPEKSKEAAENLAKLILQGYVRLTDFADKQLQVSEKKMLKIRAAGKIDMETPIPIEGGMVTFEEFIRTYNHQTRGTLTVEPEFVEDVLPRLTSVLAKRGQGLSDEQYLLGAFGAHVGINMQKFFAQQSTMKQFMAYGMEMTKRYREQEPEPAYARQAPQQPAPPPAPTPQTPPAAPQPAPNSPGPQAAAPVVPMFDAEMAPGAAQQFAMPQWGGKEKDRALKAASKRGKQAVAANTDLTRTPSSRKKIPRKSRVS